MLAFDSRRQVLMLFESTKKFIYYACCSAGAVSACVCFLDPPCCALSKRDPIKLCVSAPTCWVMPAAGPSGPEYAVNCFAAEVHGPCS